MGHQGDRSVSINWRGGKFNTYIYDCILCQKRWAAYSRVSTCKGCGSQLYPTIDTQKPSKRVPMRKMEAEQMHLG